MSGNNPRSLRRLMSDLGLHDAIAFDNPGQTRGETMKTGGTETNDHILITTGVLKSIRSAGELQYDTTYIADHPSLFLNIDGAMLSQNFTHFCNSGSRNIRSNDKKACNKYVAILEKLCKQNAIFTRMDKLLKIHPTKWTPNHTVRLNNADAHLTRLMLRAEKKCKKRNGKGHMASEELHLATSRLSYWHHLKKSLPPTRKILQTTLDRKRRFAKIPDHPPLSK
jgi:hypothetical protein